MGNKPTVARKYIRRTLKKPARIDNKLLFITHAGMRPEALEEITQMVEKRIKFEQVIYQKASPAISINCGPESFGLLFMEK